MHWEEESNLGYQPMMPFLKRLRWSPTALTVCKRIAVFMGVYGILKAVMILALGLDSNTPDEWFMRANFIIVRMAAWHAATMILPAIALYWFARKIEQVNKASDEPEG
jgi:hypothetical protein